MNWFALATVFSLCLFDVKHVISSSQLNKTFWFVDIVQLSLIIFQNQPVRHRQVVLTHLGFNVLWILYSKIKLTMHLYRLLHQYYLCVIRLYYKHLLTTSVCSIAWLRKEGIGVVLVVLYQSLIVHSVFWLWTVQFWVLSWLPWKQRCVVRW